MYISYTSFEPFIYKYIFLKVQNLQETNYSGKDSKCLHVYMFNNEDNPFLRVIKSPISWVDSRAYNECISV